MSKLNQIILFTDSLVSPERVGLFLLVLTILLPGFYRGFFFLFLDFLTVPPRHLLSCLEINSQSEIGTFHNRLFTPFYLQYLWDVVLWLMITTVIVFAGVASKKAHARFSSVWLLPD